MLYKVRAFLAREDGAITADWVVLTAGIVMTVTACLLIVRAEAITSVVQIFSCVEQSGI